MSATTSTYTLSQVRQLARMSSRNTMDSAMYSDANIDFAFQRAADEYMRIARPARVLGTLTLTANSVDLPAAPSDWSTDRHLQATLLCNGALVNPNITMIDYNQIEQNIWLGGGTTSVYTTGTTPTWFAYKNHAMGKVYPPATDSGFTILYWYWQQFTSWTPGQAALTASVQSTAGAYISGVTVNSGGYYLATPTLTVVDSGTGNGATLTPVMTNGVITSVTVNASGVGYTNATVYVNGSTAADITFNIIDEGLRVIAGDGVMAYLQEIEPQNAGLAEAAEERFIRRTKQIAARSQGGRGVQVWTADNPNASPLYGAWNPYGPNGPYIPRG